MRNPGLQEKYKLPCLVGIFCILIFLTACRQDRRILVLAPKPFQLAEEGLSDSIKLYQIWFDRIELPLDSVDFQTWKMLHEARKNKLKAISILKELMLKNPQPEIAELLLNEPEIDSNTELGLRGFIRLAKRDIAYAGTLAENLNEVNTIYNSYPFFDSTASLQELISLVGPKKRLFGFSWLVGANTFLQIIGKDRFTPDKMWFRIVFLNKDSILSTEVVYSQVIEYGTEWKTGILMKQISQGNLIHFPNPEKADTLYSVDLNNPENWLGDKFIGSINK